MEKDVAIFVGLVLGSILTIAIAYFMGWLNYGVIALILLAFVLFFYTQYGKYFVELKQYERAVVFTRGKFSKVAGPGWLFLIPGLQSYRLVDLRVHEVDVEPQEVLSKNGVSLTVDAIIYLKIKDDCESVKKAILEVEDYARASVDFVKARLRNEIGKMEWEKVIGSVDEINKKLHEDLSKIAEKWGVQVEKVEIKEIKVPPEIEKSIKEKEAAEREKEARIERAEGVKQELLAIKDAVEKMDDKVLSYFYMETLKKMAEGKASKIIIPIEVSKLAEAITSRIGGTEKTKKEIERLLVKEAEEDILKKLRRKKTQ
jgi:regulator of protease activity HflC (stomatin/prohibitin superfamily)